MKLHVTENQIKCCSFHCKSELIDSVGYLDGGMCLLVTLMAVLILLLRFSGPLVLSQLSVRQADTPQYS